MILYFSCGDLCICCLRFDYMDTGILDSIRMNINMFFLNNCMNGNGNELIGISSKIIAYFCSRIKWVVMEHKCGKEMSSSHSFGLARNVERLWEWGCLVLHFTNCFFKIFQWSELNAERMMI